MVLHVNLMKVSLTPFVAIFSCEACFTETFERVMFILCHAGASVLTRRRRTTTLQKEEKLVNTKINIVAQVVPYFNWKALCLKCSAPLWKSDECSCFPWTAWSFCTYQKTITRTTAFRRPLWRQLGLQKGTNDCWGIQRCNQRRRKPYVIQFLAHLNNGTLLWGIHVAEHFVW